jgi:Asp-tRNA(Asn)/Glu-tRNA(Gln) amidotransferase A subunit family amidase
MQVMGKPFGEGRLLQMAHIYQQVTDWHKRKPNL